MFIAKYKNIIFIFIIATLLSAFCNLFVYAEEIEEDTGIVYINTLPKFTDEEFLNAPVRMEIFVADWCKYCNDLKESMIDAIYNKFTSKEVAIRLLDKDNPKVEEYMNEFEEKFDMEGKDNLKGRIPAIIINGKYLLIGYGGKETDDLMIKSINSLLNGEGITLLKTYSLKSEFEGTTDNLIYQYHSSTSNEDTKEEKEKENTNNNPQEKEPTSTSSLADNITFFAVQGLYDSKNFPIYAYILALLLYFIEYKKFKIGIFTGLYILGIIVANIFARYKDFGMALYRQPIFIGLSLVFSILSLSIFWDIYFATLTKNKHITEYKRSKILMYLEKLLNKNWVYLIVPLFSFSIYFFTTPFDRDYGLVLYYHNIPFALKIILLIINGFCASVLTLIIGLIIKKCKKMNKEIIIPKKQYGYYYVFAVFYLLICILCIYFIFKVYYYPI